MLQINGVAVATPKTFKVTVSDLDGETKRNAKGQLLRDRIAVKRKLSCEWPALSMSDISALLNAVKDVFFSINYPDPMDGAMATRTFYVGDRESPILKAVNGIYMWDGLTMDFIEQ